MLKDYTMTPNRAGMPVWRPAQPVIGREDEHQAALTQWARMMRTQYQALQLYHHIPNGGLRDKRTAARLIGQGVHSGVPDVFIPAARGGYHGIYIELKTGDNRASQTQNEFMSGAMAEGYYCAVCYGWPCAAAVIEDYLRMPADGWQNAQENPEPLTLDELRQMDGEPVWDDVLKEWCAVKMNYCSGKGGVLYFDGGINDLSEKRFYRHKPKEETK